MTPFSLWRKLFESINSVEELNEATKEFTIDDQTEIETKTKTKFRIFLATKIITKIA